MPTVVAAFNPLHVLYRNTTLDKELRGDFKLKKNRIPFVGLTLFLALYIPYVSVNAQENQHLDKQQLKNFCSILVSSINSGMSIYSQTIILTKQCEVKNQEAIKKACPIDGSETLIDLLICERLEASKLCGEAACERLEAGQNCSQQKLLQRQMEELQDAAPVYQAFCQNLNFNVN